MYSFRELPDYLPALPHPRQKTGLSAHFGITQRRHLIWFSAESTDGIVRRTTTEEQTSKAAWESSGALNHATGLLSSTLLCSLFAFHGNRKLSTFSRDSFLEWNAGKQPQFTALALCLVFALVSQKVFPSSFMNRHALQLSSAVQLDDKENPVSPPATFAESGFILEKHRPLKYRAEVPWLQSVRSSSVKNREQ